VPFRQGRARRLIVREIVDVGGKALLYIESPGFHNRRADDPTLGGTDIDKIGIRS
jgi:hypothetical protein